MNTTDQTPAVKRGAAVIFWPKLTIRRLPDPKISERLRSHFNCDGGNHHEGKAECVSCGATTWLHSHRGFHITEDRTIQVSGSLAQLCHRCEAKTPGMSSWGKDANVTYRDHQILSTALGMARALQMEAKGVHPKA